MPGEAYSAVVMRLMFDYASLNAEQIRNSAAPLTKKLIRWLAANHPDNRTRLIFFEMTDVAIGTGTVLNGGLTIYDDYQPRVRFGDRVAVAAGVTVVASSNPNNSELAAIPYVAERLIRVDQVSIGNDAWIGARAIILGTNVGEGAIIGAGAVVTRDVEPYTVVAGVPARVVRTLR